MSALPPPAPTLVLLHAFPFDGRIFDGLRAALIEAGGPDPITPALHGSGVPTLDKYADDVVAGLDARGVDRAVIGGVSMGGYIALNLLRRHPTRIAGLVLIDTKASADAAPALANRAAVAERADQGIRPLAAELLAGMLSPVSQGERPEVVRRLTAIIDAQPLVDIAWNQRAMAGRPDSTGDLALTHLPILVVVGSDDTITPPAASREMATSGAQSTLIEVPVTGHLAVAEDPAAVASAIQGWWAVHFGNAR